MKTSCEIFIAPTKYGKAAFGFTENREKYFYSFCPDGNFVPLVEQIIKQHPFQR